VFKRKDTNFEVKIFGTKRARPDGPCPLAWSALHRRGVTAAAELQAGAKEAMHSLPAGTDGFDGSKAVNMPA